METLGAIYLAASGRRGRSDTAVAPKPHLDCPWLLNLDQRSRQSPRRSYRSGR
jgi:hypothetical protein